jgi:hypothetical protein
MINAITVPELPLITDAKTFFNADKVLVIDVLSVDEMPNLMRLKLQIERKLMSFNDKFYMPLCVKCEPQNLFLKLTNGIPFEIIPGTPSLITWDRDLNSMLGKKKIYNLSYYRNAKEVIYERGWLYDTFIFPYEGKNLKRKGLNYSLDNTAIMNVIKL